MQGPEAAHMECPQIFPKIQGEYEVFFPNCNNSMKYYIKLMKNSNFPKGFLGFFKLMGIKAVKLSLVKACLQDKLLSTQQYEARVVLNVITVLNCPAVKPQWAESACAPFEFPVGRLLAFKQGAFVKFFWTLGVHIRTRKWTNFEVISFNLFS